MHYIDSSSDLTPWPPIYYTFSTFFEAVKHLTTLNEAKCLTASMNVCEVLYNIVHATVKNIR